MTSRLRFAGVVTLYEAQEKDARRRLGELERRRQEHVERMRFLLDERHAAASTTGVVEREQLSRYWLHTEGQIRQLQESQSRIEQDVIAAREALAECHRSLAMFRKLQERDAAARARQAERRAQQRMEEFASRTFYERHSAMSTKEVSG